MFKIDQTQSLFDCCLCNNMIVDPIAIVCGNTICKSHIKFHNFKLSPIFDECKQLIEETKESAAKIEAITNNPESFIYEYFSELNRNVEISDIFGKIIECHELFDYFPKNI